MTNPNLLIFFAGGLGGNHLANILALSGRYVYPVNYARYHQGFAHAHHTIPHDKRPRTIHTFHFRNDDQEIRNLLDQPGSQCVSIHLPVMNPLAWQRFEWYNKVKIQNSTIHWDLEKLYKQEYLAKIYPSQWCTVLADDFFQDQNIDQWLVPLEHHLDISISDRGIVQNIHSAWLNSVRASLQQPFDEENFGQTRYQTSNMVV